MSDAGPRAAGCATFHCPLKDFMWRASSGIINKSKRKEKGERGGVRENRNDVKYFIHI